MTRAPRQGPLPGVIEDAAVLAIVAEVRARRPLVHCITATVSMPLVADGLLAAGARPVMTETRDEAPTMTGIASNLLVNLGTLSTDAVDGIPAAVEVAAARGLPWVLDPTAVGLPPVRTDLARRLLARRPAVVRGNASEILALGGQGRGGSGADAVAVDPGELADAARALAERTGGVVSVSGPVDLLVAGGRTRTLDRGTPMLTRVTGTGCLLGALTAAAVAVAPDPADGALAAATWLAAAGELAAARTRGPGSFRIALIDSMDEVAR